MRVDYIYLGATIK